MTIHKTTLLADALLKPFSPDKLAADFELDMLCVRLACIWACANNVAEVVREYSDGNAAIYSLTTPNDVSLALDLAHAILTVPPSWSQRLADEASAGVAAMVTPLTPIK